MPEDAVSGIEFQLPAENFAVLELLVVLEHGFRARSLLLLSVHYLSIPEAQAGN